MLTQVFNVVTFVLLAASALFLWWRGRDSASAWLAGAWGCLGVAVLVGLALPSATTGSTTWQYWLGKLGVMLPILLYPYCLLRFAASFDQRRIVSRVAGALTAAVAGGMVALPYWPVNGDHPWWWLPWQIGFFVQWVGLPLLAAFRLWRAGRTEPAVTKRRMRLMSVGASILSAVVLLPFVTESGTTLTRVLSTGVVAVAAACVLIGLNPPALVRLVWRRGEHTRVYDMQITLIAAETRSDVATAVLPVLTGLLGCGAAAMLEEDGRVVVAEGSPDDVDELMRDVCAEGSLEASRRVVRFRLGSGSIVAQTGRYAPVFGSDEVRLFESTCLMVDSALNRIDNRDELAHAHERALEASRLKSEFLANMSHEIRTPINGVIGLTELLSVTELNEEQKAYTATIQSSADALLSVLNDILDFSKIEAGKLDLNLMDFNLSAAVEDIVALLAGAANHKHIELAMAIDESVPVAVQGDVGRLRQVLLNLAGNAVKFTDTGEVVIRVGAVPGQPGAEGTTRCRFEVIDSGAGIASDKVGALFDSFSQADTSSTRQHGGTGLGLAISKRLVELMGGTIQVETELRRGSRFWFELDLAPASESWVVAPAVGVLHDRSVLIVDDNAVNRTILVQTAKGWNMDTVAVADVEHALVELNRRHAAGGQFDLAWIDHQMPGKNGTDLAREMAADERFRATARILLTSSGDRSGLKNGELHAHLTKPVRPSVLLECVTQLLSRTEVSAVGEESELESVALGSADQESLKRESLGLVSSGMQSLKLKAGRLEGVEPGPCVLVAEDNPVSQEVARRMLESLGCTVDIVGNGGEALTAACGRPYGVVFMDCQMPVMDGYEATAALREVEGESRHTTVVALTASAMKGDAERCLKAGMDDYLTKPVRIADFRAALTRWQGPPAPPPAVPAVDLTSLSALGGGDEEDNDILVELFLDTTTAQLEQMHICAAAGDFAALRRLCHAVRGGAHSLGAPRLAELCQALEVEPDKAGGQDKDRGQHDEGERNGEPQDLSRHLQAIEGEFERVRHVLLREFPGLSEPTDVSGVGTTR